MEATNEAITGTIRSWNTARVQALVDECNATARKLGLPELSVWFSEPRPYRFTDAHGIQRTHIVRDFEVDGAAPFLEGWQVVGHVDCSHEAAIVTVLADDLDDSVAIDWRSGDLTACDHCNTARNRHDVFMIRHEDGRMMQVGSTCLDDFTSKSITTLIYRVLKLRRVSVGFDEERFATAQPMTEFPTEDMLAAALFVADKQGGYLSRSKAMHRDSSTASQAFDLLYNLDVATIRGEDKVSVGFDEMKIEDVLAGIYDRIERAREIIEALLEAPADNNFMMNLQAALGRDFADEKTVGLVASAIAAIKYREDDEDEDDDSPESAHVGEVGERLEVDAALEFETTFEGYYGLTTIQKYRTESGDLLVWFTSSPLDVDKGESVRIRATVKDHDEYKGEKQTKVNRVSLV